MSFDRTPFAAVAVATLVGGLAGGQTVTVTSTADVVDINASTATVADLPGPNGLVSLSEALIATNNTPGHQTIAFAIPTSDPGFGFLLPGRAVFTSITGFYWRANDEVTIDGTTQTAFAGDTNPNGAEVALYGDPLYLNADGCTLIGFDSSAIQASGSSCVLTGNTGTTNITLFGGSNGTVRGNSGGTLKIDRSSGNLVVGNTFQRVRVLGFGTSQPAQNNIIGGPDPADRNYLTGYGTWNSEGLPAGAAVQLVWTKGTVIENSWIGTTPDGLAQGNLACTMGISLQTENRDLVVRGNRIAGILGRGKGPHHAGQLFGWAVYFWGSTSNIEFVGNTIGLDANNEPVLGSVRGVDVDNYAGYTVSGVRFVDNEIAGHLLEGARVGPTASIRFSGTRFHSNGSLGIDLVPDGFASGVSPNDPLDADTGGNGVQNFPVVRSATSLGRTLRVRGRLHSSPLDAFTLEFFASSGCDPSGFGEGERSLGTTAVTTNASGDATFDALLSASVPAGHVVTATATLEPLGLTSELSACRTVVETRCQASMGLGGPGRATLSLCGGDLATGTSAQLVLQNAPPDQPAFLGLGTTFAPTALATIPTESRIVFFTDATGSIRREIPGGGGPLTLYAQFVYRDPARPDGWGASNALRVDLLP